jgi:integrase/recombinase XerD
MDMSLIDDFQADCELQNIGATKIYTHYATEFCTFLAARGKQPPQVGREDLKAFLQAIRDRGLKSSSQERIFSVISQLCAFMVEEGMMQYNPVPPFRKRYFRQFKKDNGSEPRQLISVDQAAMLVKSVLRSRDKAILALLFKTGMRLGELCRLDVEDVNMHDMSLVLKPTAKRSNRLLFFDYEAARLLQAWLNVRPGFARGGSALFPSRRSERISTHEVEVVVCKQAAYVGLHDPASQNLQHRFTPHCCRHWFSTHLFRAGMEERYIAWLRGDAQKGSIGQYIHINPEDVRRAYLAHIPQLGI